MVKTQEVTILHESLDVQVCPVSTPVTGTCWGMDTDGVKYEQNKDIDLNIILAWVKDQQTPSDGAFSWQVQLQNSTGLTRIDVF